MGDEEIRWVSFSILDLNGRLIENVDGSLEFVDEGQEWTAKVRIGGTATPPWVDEMFTDLLKSGEPARLSMEFVDKEGTVGPPFRGEGILRKLEGDFHGSMATFEGAGTLT